MTKEEKIKEAYGEHFEKCNPDENGWTKETKDTSFLHYEDIFELNEYPKIGFNGEAVGCEKWRPKSLSCIENNNGWNVLKGIKNEITHDGDIWILNKNGNIELWLESQFLAIGYATHWKPVIKPKPPIY